MALNDAYHYVRHRWWEKVEVEDLIPQFEKKFKIELKLPPEDEGKMSIHIYTLKELWVKADTLAAFMSAYRAVLFQKKKAPFTQRDLELRKKVFSIYPHSRPTPLPFNVNTEPKFDVEDTVVGKDLPERAREIAHENHKL